MAAACAEFMKIYLNIIIQHQSFVIPGFTENEEPAWVDSDGLLLRVQGHEDVRAVFHDAYEQVVDVLLQLRYLFVSVRQLLLLLEHQRDELGMGQLGIRPFWSTIIRLQEHCTGTID